MAPALRLLRVIQVIALGGLKETSLMPILSLKPQIWIFQAYFYVQYSHGSISVVDLVIDFHVFLITWLFFFLNLVRIEKIRVNIFYLSLLCLWSERGISVGKVCIVLNSYFFFFKL